MKKLFTSILFVAALAAAHAQTVVWQHTYTIAGSTLRPSIMVSHSSGLYSAGNELVTSTGIRKLRVVKHSLSGSVLYSNSFPLTTGNDVNTTNMLCDATGNIYVLVSVNNKDCYLFSYSPTLAYRWSKPINFNYESIPVDMAFSTSNTLLLLVNNRANGEDPSTADAGVMKLNMADGTTVLSFNHPDFYARKIKSDLTGKIYICGEDDLPYPAGSDAMLVKYSATGVFQWSKYFAWAGATSTDWFSFYDIAFDFLANHIYVCGSSSNASGIIIKYSASGALTASHSIYASSGSYASFLNIETEPSGNVIAFGHKSASGSSMALAIHKLTSSLSSIISSTSSPVSFGLGVPSVWALNKINNPNGTYTFMPNVSQHGPLFSDPLFKINTSGAVVFSSYTSNNISCSIVNIPGSSNPNNEFATLVGSNWGQEWLIRRYTGPAARETSDISEETTAQKSLQCYPNPASAYVTIEGMDDIEQTFVYGSNGKQCHVAINKTDEDNALLHVENLKDGVYFIRNSLNQKTTKLVVKH